MNTYLDFREFSKRLATDPLRAQAVQSDAPGRDSTEPFQEKNKHTLMLT